MGGFGEATATGGAVTTRSSNSRGGRRAASWSDRHFHRLAVLPTTVVMLFVFGIPLLFSAWLSLEAWSPDQRLFDGRFAGWAN